VRRLIAATIFLLAWVTALPADQVQEKELADAFMVQLVGLAKVALADMDSAQPGVTYAKMPNEHTLTPCYPLAYLYRTRHPLNPFFGDKKVFQTAVDICDHIARLQSTLEWPLYNLCQTAGLLRDELDPATLARWKDYAAYYVSQRGNQPFFYTSWNHEAWSCLAIYRAGQIFDVAEWRELGSRLEHQMLKVQTELGYFDEGPHHGPSLKYNQVQLQAMMLFADYAGDEKVLESAKKLADFMIRYSFPDGTPMGTFDGRQSWSLGYEGMLLYGLDRWPQGKEINRRLFQTRKRWNIIDPAFRYYGISDWYVYFGYAFMLDEYLSLLPEAPAGSLPQDADGCVVSESGKSFDGGYARSHGWVVALSAINSDIPRQVESIYRLERQSRLDVWHEKTGLLLGGGHNLREVEVPLANFQVITGHAGVDCDFGLVSGGENWNDRRAVYIPRAVRADITAERQILTESYGQGDVSFEVRPLDEKRLRIIFRHDLFSTRRLFVQLPLVVFYDSRLKIDGRDYADREVEPVRETVEMSGSIRGATVRLTLPPGLQARIRPGEWPIRWYGGEHPPQHWEPYYRINLISVRVDDPARVKEGEFRLEIVE